MKKNWKNKFSKKGSATYNQYKNKILRNHRIVWWFFYLISLAWLFQNQLKFLIYIKYSISLDKVDKQGFDRQNIERQDSELLSNFGMLQNWDHQLIWGLGERWK